MSGVLNSSDGDSLFGSLLASGDSNLNQTEKQSANCTSQGIMNEGSSTAQTSNISESKCDNSRDSCCTDVDEDGK
jgi:hypothetical protein